MTLRHLGLSDPERREMDTNRRARNCFAALAGLIVMADLLAKLADYFP